MSDWIDLPIISAIEYFQGILGYFLNFAQKYGSFFGLIGLVWTGIRLVNSRIDLRSAWWDSLSKWFIFILLINFYAAGTSLISSISNEIGLNVGSVRFNEDLSYAEDKLFVFTVMSRCSSIMTFLRRRRPRTSRTSTRMPGMPKLFLQPWTMICCAVPTRANSIPKAI